MIYTIDNPKIVKMYFSVEENKFTGVVKDELGTIAFYENGEYHRTDGPTVIYANGHKEWRINRNIHREDGPAIEWANDDKSWYYNGWFYGWNNDFTVESWIKKWKLEIFK